MPLRLKDPGCTCQTFGVLGVKGEESRAQCFKLMRLPGFGGWGLCWSLEAVGFWALDSVADDGCALAARLVPFLRSERALDSGSEAGTVLSEPQVLILIPTCTIHFGNHVSAPKPCGFGFRVEDSDVGSYVDCLRV